MEISIKTVAGKTINLQVDDSSDTIDLKIHGPTRKLVLRLGPDPESDSDQEVVIKLFVSTLAGKTFNLEVEETETIGNIKAKIHGQGGPPVDQQALMFQGKQLDNRWTVGDYKIKTNSNLVMMSRLCCC